MVEYFDVLCTAAEFNSIQQGHDGSVTYMREQHEHMTCLDLIFDNLDKHFTTFLVFPLQI